MMPGLLGCAHATTKRLYQEFGPLSGEIIYEDRALAFRAFCAGGFIHVAEKLVRYRRHSDSLTSLNFGFNINDLNGLLVKKRNHLDQCIVLLANYMADIDVYCARSDKDGLKLAIMDQMCATNREIDIYSRYISVRISKTFSSFWSRDVPARRKLVYFVAMFSPAFIVIWQYMRAKRLFNTKIFGQRQS